MKSRHLAVVMTAAECFEHPISNFRHASHTPSFIVPRFRFDWETPGMWAC